METHQTGHGTGELPSHNQASPNTKGGDERTVPRRSLGLAKSSLATMLFALGATVVSGPTPVAAAGSNYFEGSCSRAYNYIGDAGLVVAATTRTFEANSFEPDHGRCDRVTAAIARSFTTFSPRCQATASLSLAPNGGSGSNLVTKIDWDGSAVATTFIAGADVERRHRTYHYSAGGDGLTDINGYMDLCQGRQTYPWGTRPFSSASTYTRIVNQNSGKCLGIAYGSRNVGGKANQWTCAVDSQQGGGSSFGRKAQEWRLTPFGGASSQRIQLYRLVASNGLGTDRCLERDMQSNGGAAQGAYFHLQTCRWSYAQTFYLDLQSDGSFTIRNRVSNKCLGVAYRSMANTGVNPVESINQWTCVARNGGEAARSQGWMLASRVAGT